MGCRLAKLNSGSSQSYVSDGKRQLAIQVKTKLSFGFSLLIRAAIYYHIDFHSIKIVSIFFYIKFVE